MWYGINMLFKKSIEKIARRADVCVNGNRPWDITIHNPRTYRKIVLGGSLGLGESYMNGWWDSNRLDEFFTHIFNAKLGTSKFNFVGSAFMFLSQYIFNMQSIRRAFAIGEKHYDIGNNLYKAMLDKRLVYTCGYWRDAHSLDEAQEAKLRLTAEKLHIKPGMRILDIGCGWGSFAKFVAEKYDVEVVGITVSKEQVTLGKEMCANLPVDIRLLDYRNLPKEYGKIFDRVVSLGMFEHVGASNYDTYFSTVRSVLKDDGIFLLHTIGTNNRFTSPDPWINKYIFPNGVIPALQQVTRAAQGKFILEDWHNFGTDYDKTLMAWYHNIENAWDTLPSYDERFKRMWKYYLLVCAGAFRTRKLQLWQIVFSNGIAGGYQSVREIKER